MSTPLSDPMLPKLYQVQRVRREIPGTFTMELEPQDGSAVPPFASGQFNMLYVFGVGEIPISISGDPDRPTPLVHTTRAVGTVSGAMQELKPGDTIGVRGPFGSHWPIEQAAGKDVVIVAGGIGLAPLRSTVYQLIARRAQYGKIALLYGARTPSDMLFRHELERWRARLDLDVYITVDRGDASWRGSVGVVTQLIRRAVFDPHNTLALICGPEIMMRFTTAELAKHGLVADHVYVSMERNMKCAVGLCGHCQYGPHFVCKDGPVFQYSQVQHLLVKAEI
ncbi:MAG TPA: FAD/NAD(P)-binding protein [Ktedonobacteraceae bacterium]|nr:FAD/NAD(P)-binding protein [Ktedonobacteraceae bacterium]